jgi:RND family efflux transporter MFP subunit
MHDTEIPVAIKPTSQEPRPGQTPSSRFLSWLVGTIVLVTAGSAGAYFYLERKDSPGSGHGSRDSNQEKPVVAMPVEVTYPRSGGIERTTSQAGSVHAFEHAELYSKVSGYLKVQNVDIGDRVKLGQLLAVIEVPEADKAVDQNKASLDQSKAKVRVAEAKVRSAQAARDAAEALVRQAETMVQAKLSNQELQDKQLKRIVGLVARQAVDQKLADEQQDRYDVAVADVGVARAEVISNQAEVMNKAALIEEAQADLIEARANVEVAEANLGRARVMLDYTKITSPYDGVITIRSYHRGDFIRSASEGGNVPLLAVARTDLVRVVFPIPDVDVPYANKGDKALLQIVALPGKTFIGEISRFSESEDAASRNMRTEIDLPNPDDKLREGMYGLVKVILQSPSPHCVTIPSTGLLNQSGTGSGNVWVVKDGIAHKVEVQVGNDTGVETEILSGVTTADQVIISYNGVINEGTPVSPEMRKGK